MASKALTAVLIGCGVVIVIGVIVIVAGGLFVKSKVDKGLDTLKNVAGTEDSEYGKRSAELQRMYPFTQPADNIVNEPQLMRYLEVRKGIFQVYKQHEGEFKEIENKGSSQDLGDALKGVNLLKDLRMAQIQALEQQKMSVEEYRWMTTAVYTSYFAATVQDMVQDGTVSDAAKENLQKSIDELDKQLQNPDLPEEAKKQAEAMKESLIQQRDALGQQLQELDQQLQEVPPQNVELFRKHDAEIKQYAMTGLEFIGF